MSNLRAGAVQGDEGGGLWIMSDSSHYSGRLWLCIVSLRYTDVPEDEGWVITPVGVRERQQRDRQAADVAAQRAQQEQADQRAAAAAQRQLAAQQAAAAAQAQRQAQIDALGRQMAAANAARQASADNLTNGISGLLTGLLASHLQGEARRQLRERADREQQKFGDVRAALQSGDSAQLDRLREELQRDAESEDDDAASDEREADSHDQKAQQNDALAEQAAQARAAGGFTMTTPGSYQDDAKTERLQAAIARASAEDHRGRAGRYREAASTVGDAVREAGAAARTSQAVTVAGASPRPSEANPAAPDRSNSAPSPNKGVADLESDVRAAWPSSGGSDASKDPLWTRIVAMAQSPDPAAHERLVTTISDLAAWDSNWPDDSVFVRDGRAVVGALAIVDEASPRAPLLHTLLGHIELASAIQFRYGYMDTLSTSGRKCGAAWEFHRRLLEAAAQLGAGRGVGGRPGTPRPAAAFSADSEAIRLIAYNCSNYQAGSSGFVPGSYLVSVLAHPREGQLLDLYMVQFPPGSSDLPFESTPILDSIGGVISQSPGVGRFRVITYSSTGQQKDLLLAKARAQAIRTYLTTHGGWASNFRPDSVLVAPSLGYEQYASDTRAFIDPSP